MRKIILVVAVLTSAAGAVAQPAQQGPSNPAVKGMHDNASTTPVAGANSFTKGEAKQQIKAKGYSHISHLMKDQNGVWRGKAMKDGASVPVSVDYQGNVN